MAKKRLPRLPKLNENREQNAHWLKAHDDRIEARKAVYLHNMREDIARKERNAKAKIRRIEKALGVGIRHTDFNPTRGDAAKIGRYTAKQLIAYGKKLDEFTNRGTRFVAGVDGAPLTKAKFDEYKKLEARVNAKADARMKMVEKKGGPGGATSAQQRSAMFPESKLKGMDGEGLNKLYVKHDRQAYNITSDKAIDKLIKDYKNRLNEKHTRKQVHAARQSASKILISLGHPELVDEYRKLNDHQFSLLWFEYAFHNEILPVYGFMHMMSAHAIEQADRVLESNIDGIRESLKWAQSLPER